MPAVPALFWRVVFRNRTGRSADKLAEMRTKFHVIQSKLIMSVWCMVDPKGSLVFRIFVIIKAIVATLKYVIVREALKK